MHPHKKWVGELFGRAAADYELNRFFSYFGKLLVEKVHLSPGERVLDVATGRGAILFPLAEAVGPSGKVYGIDISQSMLDATAQVVKQQKLTWVQLQQMDAEKLEFPDQFFDHIFCGFAIFFFPDLPKALSEFKRVLKPCGTVAISILGKNSRLKTWLDQETAKYKEIEILSAAPKLDNEKELQNVLEKAGLANIQIISERKIFTYESAEEWWRSLWYRSSRSRLEQLSAEQLEDLHAKALKKAAELHFSEDMESIFGIAKKPIS